MMWNRRIALYLYNTALVYSVNVLRWSTAFVELSPSGQWVLGDISHHLPVPQIAQPGRTVSFGNIYFRMMEAAVPLETFNAAGNVFVAFLRSVHSTDPINVLKC